MDQLTIAVWGLVATIAIAFVGWFFKSPKESQTELSSRVDELEDKHHTLDKDFSKFSERVIAELRHLTQAIDRLSMTIDAKGARISGGHRTLGPK